MYLTIIILPSRIGYLCVNHSVTLMIHGDHRHKCQSISLRAQVYSGNMQKRGSRTRYTMVIKMCSVIARITTLP